MSSRITSHDVARAAGVSQATVSRALRGDRKISSATIARVTAVADELGYVPSSLGRSLSRKSTGNIAVVAELGNLTVPETLPAMHDELSAHGFRLVLVSETLDQEMDQGLLFDGSVDGVILTTSRLGSELPARLQRKGVPFVFLNRVARGVEADSVVADNSGGGRAAARLLLGDGHTRIAMVSGPADMSSAAARERAFTAELRGAGLDARVRPVIRTGLDHASGEAAWAKLVALPSRPTAVFCASDAIAVGLLNACRRHGAVPPAVVGFDNSPVAAWPSFDLTTIDAHLPQMARAASTMLVERISSTMNGDDGPPHRRVTVPTELVIRQSHAPG